MGTRQYIGARYVPKFANPIAWDSANSYEALTIVTYNGTSYTSKKSVPAGTAITNTEYWVATGNYNAQVELYRQEVERLAETATKSFDTVMDMVNGNCENGDRVATYGYYDVNDGGGACYYIRNKTESDVVSVNTDGTTSSTGVIKISDTLVAELIFDSVINVKCMGAIGNGTFDNYAIFTNAIGLGDVVFIPSGVYAISQHLSVPHSKTIMGCGSRNYNVNDLTIIKNTSQNDYAMIFGENEVCNEVKLCDFRITCTSTNYGIKFGTSENGCFNVTVENILIYYGVIAFNFNNCWNFNCRILTVTAATTGYSFGTDNLFGGNSSEFSSCLAYNCTTGFRINKVYSCTFIGCGTDYANVAFELADCDVCIITPHIERTTTDFFRLTSNFCICTLINPKITSGNSATGYAFNITGILSLRIIGGLISTGDTPQSGLFNSTDQRDKVQIYGTRLYQKQTLIDKMTYVGEDDFWLNKKNYPTSLPQSYEVPYGGGGNVNVVSKTLILTSTNSYARSIDISQFKCSFNEYEIVKVINGNEYVSSGAPGTITVSGNAIAAGEYFEMIWYENAFHPVNFKQITVT